MMRGSVVFFLLLGCREELPTASITPSVAVEVVSSASGGRSLKRMDIDQLDASLFRATGVRWSEVVDGETSALFESLSGSLGKPDYQASTDEDRTAGLLFQKFLDDAARMTCAEAVRRETSGGIEDKRILVMAQVIDRPPAADDAIDANLAELLLRLHGKRVRPGTEAHAPWRGLFDAVYAATADPSESWRAVCVALVSHPDFYAY